MPGMTKRFSILAAALLSLAPATAWADASSFTLVNATAANMTSVSIRRSGTASWRPLGVAPPAGGQGAVQFSDPDCAFDIEASLSGAGTAIWSGVNLCEVKIVRLNRSDSGAVWVDYD